MRVASPIAAHEKREKVLAWNPSKSAFRASPAPRGHRPPSGGKFELLLPRARRKHVIWAPLGELRALIEVRMHELLSLPRSARRADGDETRSRAKSGEAGDWADRNAAFCCSFCSRRSHLTHATGHFSPAASGRSFISPLVFLAQGAPKQSARNQGAPRFSDTVVCLRSDCPSFPPAAPHQQQLQGSRARAGGAAVKERQQEEGGAAGRRRGNSRGSSSRGRGSRGSRGSSSRGSRGRGRGSSSDRNAPAASSHRTQGQLQQSSSQTS